MDPSAPHQSNHLASQPDAIGSILSSANLPPLPLSSAQPPLRHESSVEIDGDAALGTVRFLKQVHTIYNEPDSELKKIGVVQLALLKYLSDQKALHIFVEGLYQNFDLKTQADAFAQYHHLLLPKKDSVSTSPEKLLEETRSLFKNIDYTLQPSDRQLFILGALGAAYVYGAIHSDVRLHRTFSVGASGALYEKQKILPLEDPKRIEYALKVRERLVSVEIRSFLKTNPGTDVYLIYGAAHDFSPAFKKYWAVPPRLESVSFPDARNQWLGATTPV